MARALLFPGQGAHKVGMGKDLYEAYESVRELYDQADALVDFDLKGLSFEGPEEELRRTDVSQPAIVVASLAAHRALEAELGGPVAGVVAACGLSLGEYTALCTAGALSLSDTLRLVIARGRAMQDCCEATPSGMVTALRADADQVQAILHEAELTDVVGIANDNAPGQVVLSGTKEGLERAAEACKAGGIKRLLPLKVAGAYHSRIMAPAGDALNRELATASLEAPKLTVIANVDVEAHVAGADMAERLVRQVSGTVRWRETMAKLAELGVTEVIELGPGGVLAKLATQNVKTMEARGGMSRDEIQAIAAALKG